MRAFSDTIIKLIMLENSIFDNLTNNYIVRMH